MGLSVSEHHEPITYSFLEHGREEGLQGERQIGCPSNEVLHLPIYKRDTVQSPNSMCSLSIEGTGNACSVPETVPPVALRDTAVVLLKRKPMCAASSYL